MVEGAKALASPQLAQREKVTPLQDAFVAKELTPPKTVEIRQGTAITIQVAPEEFGTSLEDIGERKVGFGIVLGTPNGQQTYYRTVESPLLHTNITGLTERNTVIEENKVFCEIAE